jgi:Domain of unknown function (DUF397)
MPDRPRRQSELNWRKSQASADSGGCVQIASTGHTVLVRDSGNLSGPLLTFTPAQWTTFTARIRGADPNTDQAQS